MAEILRVFPHTLFLAVGAVVLAVLIGIPLGMISAVRNNTAFDHLSRVLALLGISMPSFWLALVLLLFLSVYTGWFPLVGAGELESPTSVLYHLFLPALALAARDAAAISRLTRSGVLEILRQDYIVTARAKGLAEKVVIYKHALRNALIPIVTVISLDLGYTLGGTVVIEAVFSRPGLGSIIIQSIYSRDYPQLQGAIMFFAFCFLLVNLTTDLIYKVIDPRINYKRGL